MFNKETCRDSVHCLKIISSSFNTHIYIHCVYIYMCVCVCVCVRARALQNRNTGFICLVISLQFSLRSIKL